MVVECVAGDRPTPRKCAFRERTRSDVETDETTERFFERYCFGTACQSAWRANVLVFVALEPWHHQSSSSLESQSLKLTSSSSALSSHRSVATSTPASTASLISALLHVVARTNPDAATVMNRNPVYTIRLNILLPPSSNAILEAIRRLEARGSLTTTTLVGKNPTPAFPFGVF